MTFTLKLLDSRYFSNQFSGDINMLRRQHPSILNRLFVVFLTFLAEMAAARSLIDWEYVKSPPDPVLLTSPTLIKELPSPDGKHTTVMEQWRKFEGNPADSSWDEWGIRHNHLFIRDQTGKERFDFDALDPREFNDLRDEPAQGAWTRSGRFYVCNTYNSQGHSPWRKTFVVFDTLQGKAHSTRDFCERPCVTEINLINWDTISFGEGRGADQPTTRSFSLSQKIDRIAPDTTQTGIASSPSIKSNNEIKWQTTFQLHHSFPRPYRLKKSSSPRGDFTAYQEEFICPECPHGVYSVLSVRDRNGKTVYKLDYRDENFSDHAVWSSSGHFFIFMEFSKERGPTPPFPVKGIDTTDGSVYAFEGCNDVPFLEKLAALDAKNLKARGRRLG
jgi:hypothetical protein